ncbi:MAG: transposase [Opitutaceae bacterium]|jgi:REP element-mobilizing transposase RayT
MPDTRERWRSRLPHWEVAHRSHFVTIRCAGSLPETALVRVREIHANLRVIPPASPRFALLQRQYFLTCEKYLDRSEGFAPFCTPAACSVALAAWNQIEMVTGWRVPHFVVMPNHVHFLLMPVAATPERLRASVRWFKGHVARKANLLLGRGGAFWQTDWFDRWVRDAAEEARIIDYIQHNPSKAGLVRDWHEYRWVR